MRLTRKRLALIGIVIVLLLAALPMAAQRPLVCFYWGPGDPLTVYDADTGDPYYIPVDVFVMTPDQFYYEDGRFRDISGDTSPVNNCIGGRIGDGRINDGGDQLAAPVAIYRTDKGIEVWKIHAFTGAGTEIIIATDEEVAAAVGDTNMLIEEAQGVSLYRLTSGEFEVVASEWDGEPYTYIFE